ncbi:MAG TPA: ATP-binding protein [Jatrophihabitans sp.]|nr:ATP-binding protein [Jatrophihabitans sp.]
MIEVADLRSLSLFSGLRDDQLADLAAAGTEVPVEPGVELFRHGDLAEFWWVLLDGAVDLYRHAGRDETRVGRMDNPGVWSGGFRAWDEHGVYLATGRGAVPGRMFRLPSDVLRDRGGVWFPFATHLIRGVFGTARSIEATARQRESLVTLGTLAAGLAHELNNPASAASRTVDSLEGACRTLLSSLGRLADGEISASQFAALDALRKEIDRPAAPVDPLELSDREEALSRWLGRHGVAEDWEIAPPFAAAGVDVDWCDRAARSIDSAALEAGLRWVASTLSAAELLTQLKEAIGRISELVAAIKSHSQMDRTPLQQIDVVDGIESSLVMLGHKIRNGVTVERAYAAGLPRIDAYAGELNQVWTNLIDNALDAMDGGGTLRVTTRADGDWMVVEVADTGTGMSPEVAARAFDAFFTTKDVGKGSGLGLDIARRIVQERHGGTIAIDSSPKGTTVRVRIPRTAR